MHNADIHIKIETSTSILCDNNCRKRKFGFCKFPNLLLRMYSQWTLFEQHCALSLEVLQIVVSKSIHLACLWINHEQSKRWLGSTCITIFHCFDRL